LQWRPFGFALPQPLVTAAGSVQQRCGWLLRLQSPQGDLGWGEAAPLDGQLEPLAAAFAALDASYGTAELERLLQAGQLPPTLAFALGAALAELAGLPQRRWLPPPPAARLLPAGPAAIEVLEQLEPELGPAPVFKWKLAVCADGLERELLELVTGQEQLPVMVQAFLPGVSAGDKRILLVDGEPLGAVNRIPAGGEFRSNLAVGGAPEVTELTAAERAICAELAPALRAEGLFFVGIDVIDGRLSEINVTSPTGVREVERLAGIPLADQTMARLLAA